MSVPCIGTLNKCIRSPEANTGVNQCWSNFWQCTAAGKLGMIRAPLTGRMFFGGGGLNSSAHFGECVSGFQTAWTHLTVNPIDWPALMQRFRPAAPNRQEACYTQQLCAFAEVPQQIYCELQLVTKTSRGSPQQQRQSKTSIKISPPLIVQLLSSSPHRVTACGGTAAPALRL